MRSRMSTWYGEVLPGSHVVLWCAILTFDYLRQQTHTEERRKEVIWRGVSHWQVRALPRRQAKTVKLWHGVLHLPHLLVFFFSTAGSRGWSLDISRPSAALPRPSRGPLAALPRPSRGPLAASQSRCLKLGASCCICMDAERLNLVPVEERPVGERQWACTVGKTRKTPLISVKTQQRADTTRSRRDNKFSSHACGNTKPGWTSSFSPSSWRGQRHARRRPHLFQWRTREKVLGGTKSGRVLSAVQRQISSCEFRIKRCTVLCFRMWLQRLVV